MKSLSALVYVLAALTQRALAECASFGVNYQEGMKYTVTHSSSPFVVSQYFTGCEDAQANNVLVDPSGAQTPCSSTEMQPDDAVSNFTCGSWTYDSMYTGAWSIIVLSNNGGENSVSFQRDFYLNFSDSSSTTSSSTDPTSTSIPDLSVLIPDSIATAQAAVTQRDLLPIPTTLLTLAPLPSTQIHNIVIRQQGQETAEEAARQPSQTAKPNHNLIPSTWLTLAPLPSTQIHNIVIRSQPDSSTAKPNRSTNFYSALLKGIKPNQAARQEFVKTRLHKFGLD